MQVCLRYLKALSAIVLICILDSAPLSSSAATASFPSKATNEPDPSKTKMLADFIKMGAHVFYLGNRSGLDGWFILKDNLVQMAYTTSDGENTLVGALFDQNGENITAAQIQAAAMKNPQLAAMMGTSNQPARPVVGAMSVATTAPPLPTPDNPSTPGDKLFVDLAGAQNVTFGGNMAAPQILMVADPSDAASQKTWVDLRDAVVKGTLRVTVIPTAAPNSDGEQIAAGFLLSPDPMSVWNKFITGDKSAIIATADPNSVVNVRANHITIDRWNIKTLPYLVYRGKDAKVKIVQGRPDNIATILADLP